MNEFIIINIMVIIVSEWPHEVRSTLESSKNLNRHGGRPPFHYSSQGKSSKSHHRTPSDTRHKRGEFFQLLAHFSGYEFIFRSLCVNVFREGPCFAEGSACWKCFVAAASGTAFTVRKQRFKKRGDVCDWEVFNRAGGFLSGR